MEDEREGTPVPPPPQQDASQEERDRPWELLKHQLQTTSPMHTEAIGDVYLCVKKVLRDARISDDRKMRDLRAILKENKSFDKTLLSKLSLPALKVG